MDSYVFTSERLGFRNWSIDDLEQMAAINADPEVMEFFPSIPTQEDTKNFILRMQKQYEQRNHCYFAVEVLETKEFIGFIGLSYQDYDTDFTPCVDIGWRLKKSSWFNGYATEGAKKCLTYAFDVLQLNEVLSTAPTINEKSIAVMQKIGMTKVKNFDHPLLLTNERLKKCSLYTTSKD
ncbi:GNAT family N-acetyltransferase [Aquimarina rhabdastrellae]